MGNLLSQSFWNALESKIEDRRMMEQSTLESLIHRLQGSKTRKYLSLWCRSPIRLLSPPALLLRGTKAAEMFSNVFLSISSHCYPASSLWFYVFRGSKNPRITFTRSRILDLFFRKKAFCFQACFRSLKVRKTVPKAFKKH